MWIVIKYDRKKLNTLKHELKLKLGFDCVFYSPKILIQKFYKNKVINKEYEILGDYIFCSHIKLKDNEVINSLNFLKGLKYILEGFKNSQKEIEEFINKCKSLENKNGLISGSIYEEKINTNYVFLKGPFANSIFKIVEIQKSRLNVLIGNIKTTINKKNLLFRPA